MTGHDFVRAPGMKYALALLAIAVGVTIWTAARAMEVEVGAVSDAAPSPAAIGLHPPPPIYPVEVGEVVSADIFSPKREAPRKRYLLPGEIEEVVATGPTPAREPPRPILLGTVMHPDSTLSFATVRMGTGGAPTNLKIGGTIGDFTLVAIDLRKVTFLNAAGQPVDVYAQR